MRSSRLDPSPRRISGRQRSTGNVCFIPVLRFSPVSIIPQIFHTHSCMYNQRYITLATGNIVKHRIETTSLNNQRRDKSLTNLARNPLEIDNFEHQQEVRIIL